MASAWPYLRCISIYSHHDARRWHCKADLRGLTYLAQNCHSLQSVSLQFDVSLPLTVMIAMHPDKITQYEWLTKLYVSRSAHQQKVTNLTRPCQAMSAPPDPLRSASLVSALCDHVLDLSTSSGPVR
jgi:hypothetical protein